jgi:hypothetical protein
MCESAAAMVQRGNFRINNRFLVRKHGHFYAATMPAPRQTAEEIIMKKMLPMLFFCLFCAQAGAQVPATGRWQSLSYSSAEVNARQESDYYELIRELADQGQINRNPAMLARLRDILASLIPAATKLHPASADWEWEIHLTSSADIDAVCFAGGKILVSEHFLLQLQLSDGGNCRAAGARSSTCAGQSSA